jgi:hypothetical protein
MPFELVGVADAAGDPVFAAVVCRRRILAGGAMSWIEPPLRVIGPGDSFVYVTSSMTLFSASRMAIESPELVSRA